MPDDVIINLNSPGDVKTGTAVVYVPNNQSQKREPAVTKAFDVAKMEADYTGRFDDVNYN